MNCHIEKHLIICVSLFAIQQKKKEKKSLLWKFVPRDEKWSHDDNLKCQKSQVIPG